MDEEQYYNGYQIPNVGNYGATPPPSTPAGSQNLGLAGLPTGLLNLGLGISQLVKARKVKQQDTIPQQLRNVAGDLALRSKSAKIGNYGQALDRITNRENTAFGNAMSAATTPSQAVQAASNIQRNSDMAEMSLADAGQDLQQTNLGQYRNVQGQMGQWTDRDRREAAARKAALQEAGWRNVGNFTNSVGSAATGFL